MKPFQLKKRSLSDQAYQYIKGLILSGQIKGGERIPEEKVGQSLGVSRTPIREALKKLSEYGLVYIKPRSYAVVVSLERNETIQINQIRALLETFSVELLTETGTDEDFDTLDRIADHCDELIADGDVANAFEQDSLFHLQLAKRTGNTHLYEIFKRLDAKVQLTRLMFQVPMENLPAYIGQHKTIVAAMRKRDKKHSKALMDQHVMQQLEHYRP